MPWRRRRTHDFAGTCLVTEILAREPWVQHREPLGTFVPTNPDAADWDRPFRGIDHVLVRCGTHGGPTLPIRGCLLVFDRGPSAVSDHYGLAVEFAPPATFSARLP